MRRTLIVGTFSLLLVLFIVSVVQASPGTTPPEPAPTGDVALTGWVQQVADDGLVIQPFLAEDEAERVFLRWSGPCDQTFYVGDLIRTAGTAAGTTELTAGGRPVTAEVILVECVRPAP